MYFKTALLKSQFTEKLQFFQQKLKKYRTFILVFIISFLLADLLILKSYHFFLPAKELPPRRITKKSGPQKLHSGQYKMIWEDNIFHRGPIPTQLVEETVSEDPVKTNLPFALKGTIVHANPHRSVATVKGRKGESKSYRVGDAIEEQAEIVQIERRKIIFLNKNNGLLEFLEIPEKQKTALLHAPSSKQITLKKFSPVQRLGQNFKLKRSVMNKYLKKLPEILQQARLVPNKVTRDGEVFMEGWRFASIQKGSVYEDLGFKVGDVLTEVEGEEINSADKALELYNQLKTNSRVQIVVNGQSRTYTVDEDAPQEL